MRIARSPAPHPPRRPHRARRGQATTEWMVLLSVLVIAIVAAGYFLADTFGTDMDTLGQRAATVYTTGDLAH